ncbi:MAG: glycerophosphodiester phosphodiesterase [Chloroflexota bacterium]|nr:glycerophosphodiester phosphodiesterase [Chloroflexota bacterium]
MHGPSIPAAAARPLRLAHRGDWRVAPENTLAALQAAIRIPACDGVEFDVRLSSDGVPVLLHDETLARVQGLPARVDELVAAERAALDVPSLAEALTALPPETFLDVELKGEDHGDATAAVLRAGRGPEGSRAVISSFELSVLAAMGDRLPGWTRWLLAADLEPATVSIATGLGCAGVAVSWSAVTPASIRAAHAGGLDVAAWTVRRRATFDRLARLGVVACCVEAAALDG